MKDLPKLFKHEYDKMTKSGELRTLVHDTIVANTKKSLDSIFESWGPARKALEKKFESVIVPYIESSDISEHTLKLDIGLNKLAEEMTGPQTALIKKFTKLFSAEALPELMTLDLVFKAWLKDSANNIDTSSLQVHFDSGPYYEGVEVDCRATTEELPDAYLKNWDRMWVHFTCEHDESLNRSFLLTKWKSSKDAIFRFDNISQPPVSELKFMSEFDILLLRLSKCYVKVEVKEYQKIIAGQDFTIEETLEPTKEPEAEFS